MKHHDDLVSLEVLLSDLGKYSEGLPEHVQSSIHDVETFLDTIQSKDACPVCGKHKLSVSENLNISDVVYYQCLNCGFEFFTDEDERRFSEKAVSKEAVSKKAVSLRKDSFWNDADRVVVMIAGGGAVGGAIAQLPGAVIGAFSAAIYSGYLFWTKKSPARNL